MTNYAVTLGKQGKTLESFKIFEELQKRFKSEIRIYNNLGIIQKRNQDMVKAEQSYLKALEIDPNSFFPNYNMGVLKSNDKKMEQDCISYFEKSLKIAETN
jgi:Flp pilus assembly protein TadD